MFKEDSILFLNTIKSLFYDDYAHHPTEINELLKSTREVYKSQKIISIFQPHRISRLNSLKKDLQNVSNLLIKLYYVQYTELVKISN